MRQLFGWLAALLCVVSIALAARYGYKGADTEIDGVISGVVFGLIALCACLFDAAAVRLWFMSHRIGAGVVGLIAAAALVVTFTNSLGAIAGRADVTQAERSRAKSDQVEDHAELRRISAERAALPAFVPADEAGVRVAQAAVAAAERVTKAECERRGPNCRQRETEEQAKRDALAAVLARKALTERAAKLDSDAARVRVRLSRAPSVQNANPLGAVLEQMIGATAAALTAWQQAIVAGVFELCLVGVMVIFELLGHGRPVPVPKTTDALAEERTTNAVELAPAQEPGPAPAARAARPKAPPKSAAPVGSVKSFVRDRVFPADGERLEIKALMQDYRTWCAQRGVTAVELDRFMDEIEGVCRKAGIVIEVGNDKRVYCLDVKLENATAEPARVH
jgi:hypothetical protein